MIDAMVMVAFFNTGSLMIIYLSENDEDYAPSGTTQLQSSADDRTLQDSAVSHHLHGVINATAGNTYQLKGYITQAVSSFTIKNQTFWSVVRIA